MSVSPTGIAEAEILEAGVKLQPNPTNGIVMLSSKYEFEKIELLSVTGQIILSEFSNEKAKQINLSVFAEGIYFVKITYVNGLNITKKLIKQ